MDIHVARHIYIDGSGVGSCAYLSGEIVDYIVAGNVFAVKALTRSVMLTPFPPAAMARMIFAGVVLPK